MMLLAPEWPERALLRAQLIEEGYDVVAVDAWPIPRLYRRPGMKPRVLLIDLHGLPHPRATLDEVQLVMPPERVLVLTALGTLTGDDVRHFGFSVIERPVTIGQIVAAAAALMPITGVRTIGSFLAPTETRSTSRIRTERRDPLEVEMRKQDRIRQQEQNHSEPQPAAKPEPQPKEQMRGSVSAEQPAKPARQGNKLPLPD
jgi:hypothetical protein